MRTDFSSNRYATDSGPQCPLRCSADGETLWIYLYDPPEATAIGQCACCHTYVQFPITPSPIALDIQAIKRAHRDAVAADKTTFPDDEVTAV